MPTALELTPSRLIPIYDLFESYIDVLASTTPTTQYPKEPPQGSPLFALAITRSFLSSVAVPVAPFELQPAPSTLQHKLSYTKPHLKAYSDPGLTDRETESKEKSVWLAGTKGQGLDLCKRGVWECVVATGTGLVMVKAPHSVAAASSSIPFKEGGVPPAMAEDKDDINQLAFTLNTPTRLL
ncbi:hypothetical protein F5051DRAFT_446878 [Lentinula edodes]|nr:hypothetical protein F5051DRAFT_446878 [Lentinula edodes]